MKKLKKHKDAGETLVEIMVSAVLFLMMMAVMQGAISFCTNAQHKSEQIRASNAKICRIIRESGGSTVRSDPYTYAFRSKSGSSTVFNIGVNLEKQEVESDGKQAVFYLFTPKGGGSP